MKIWRPVPDYEDIYEVSSVGEVRRIVPGAGRAKVGHVLRPGKNRKGYQAVNLCREGACQTKHLHVLVCEVFHGPRPTPKHQAAHRDDDKANIAASNLYWATPLENHADRRRNGRILRGEQIGRATLREFEVVQMKALAKSGAMLKDIASKFGVNPNTVGRIVSGKRWAHVA